MNHFIVTYRIKGDETYQARYDSFIRKLKEGSDQVYWNETSSFYAMASDMSAKELCASLCNDTGFDCCKDAVVVIDTVNRTSASSGAIGDSKLLMECLGF